MNTTIAKDAVSPEPPQERPGRPGVHRGVRKAPDGTGIERRLNLHSVHILALEAVIAALPTETGIDAARVYAYIDARTGKANANLGASAKKVAAELMQAAGTASAPKPRMMKRAASWLIAGVAAIAIVTAGFVGVAVLILKTGFGG